jgi:hypothetical protein
VLVKDIGFITCGDGAQLTCVDDYARYIDAALYLRALDSVDLTDYRAIVVPDFSNRELLQQHAEQLNAYLARGGFLVVFEPNRMDRWLRVVEVPWFQRETEDWQWWRKPGHRLEVYQPEPKHPLVEAIDVAAMAWHFNGAFRFVDGAVPILNLDNDEGCIMYDQRLASGGRLMASTLDPHSHHGRRFMPATTRFLNGFYPWLKAEVRGEQT